MDTKKLVLLGKIFNIFEIVLAFVMFMAVKIASPYIDKANNSIAMSVEDYLSVKKHIDNLDMVYKVAIVLSLITIAFTVYLFIVSKGRISMLAIGLLLVAGVLTCGFGLGSLADYYFVHAYFVILPAGYSLRLFAETPVQYEQPQNGFVNQ